MKNNLESAFVTYVSLVVSTLNQRRQEERRRTQENKNRPPRITLFVDYSRRDRWKTERSFVEAERSGEFNKLIEETRSFSSGEGPSMHRLWEVHVKNFLRRSGIYLDLFDGKEINMSAAFADYCRAFERPQTEGDYQKHCLAVIEHVGFPAELLDFGSFQIRQFSEQDLGELLGNRVNSVFFPEASLRVNKLADYWFIYVTESPPAQPVGGGQYVEYFDPLIKMRYTDFPSRIESAVRPLALYDWNYDWETFVVDSSDRTQGWFRFKVPFVLVKDDSPLHAPNAAPDLSVLSMRLTWDEEGESEGAEPDLEYLTPEGATFFVESVQRAEKLLANLRPSAWPFFDIAMGYFLKAFFSDGSEQLLWHITVLDALLGDNEGGGRTNRIGQRLGSILGQGAEQEAIRKQFRELHDYRNELVHGYRLENRQVYTGHLREARELARRSMWWFLSFLNHMQSKFPEGSGKGIPSRKEVLKLIDLDIDLLARLIDGLPRGFPQVSEWDHRTPEQSKPVRTTRW
jgi:hypothetical protein